MRRREVFATIVGGLLSDQLAAATEPGRVFRVGVLDALAAEQNVNFAAFRARLRELDYVEGRNLAIEYRSSEGQNERFVSLAEELVRIPVDIIAARGAPATLAAKAATRTIPVVMTGIPEPLLAVASLSHPGGNVTGLTTSSNDLQTKRLELIRELVPRLQKVAFLTNLSNPATRLQWDELEGAAVRLPLSARLLDARSVDDIQLAFRTAKAERVGALVVSTDGLVRANFHLIIELCAQHALPAIYGFGEFVQAGALIAYGPSYRALYRKAALYVDKILKGASPADMPVEEPTEFELLINSRTAHILGLTVPPSLLARADEVIE